MADTGTTARTVRQRAREELTREVVATARRHLAVDGAAGLSLRAVARDLGMVSSAVYRYVPSRDDLLTRLIVEAYDALGLAAERAEAKVDRADLAGRWLAIATATRRWALRHPHEYALVFGTPVPGYAAPQDTIGPASRIPALLVALLAEAVAADPAGAAATPAVPDEVRRAMAPIRAFMPPQIPDDLAMRGLMAWTYLIGTVSMEVFGQRHNVVADAPGLREAFFTDEMHRIAATVSLAGPRA